jgi:hypothetical protein
MLFDQGYNMTNPNVEWCTTYWDGERYRCSVQEGCSAGGGGGGGGVCHVPYGDFCPMECMSCTYWYN